MQRSFFAELKVYGEMARGRRQAGIVQEAKPQPTITLGTGR
jgi:hypothetical protein